VAWNQQQVRSSGMISRDKVRSSVIEAVTITSFSDAVEKVVYVLAALVAIGILWFLIFFMGVKVFIFFVLFFMFLVMAKGLFVILIK
jgi:hypothetical protein